MKNKQQTEVNAVEYLFTVNQFAEENKTDEPKKQTAVEWLVEQLLILDKQLDGRRKNEDSTVLKLNPTKLFTQAKEIEKQRMIQLVQQLKDYTRESGNVLGYDEREASEFVDIFLNKTYRDEKQ